MVELVTLKCCAISGSSALASKWRGALGSVIHYPSGALFASIVVPPCLGLFISGVALFREHRTSWETVSCSLTSAEPAVASLRIPVRGAMLP